MSKASSTEEEATKPSLNVVDFPTPDYLDPVKLMRNVAEDIEEGLHGEISTVCVVLWNQTEGKMEIFGGGPDSAAPTCSMLLQAAGLRFVTELLL